MYQDKTTYGVTSTLIYGIQWDAIMSWIDPNYKTSNCEDNSFVKNSGGKGYYTGDLGEITKTGLNDNYRINNIYDLAGNVEEWTMEAYSNKYRVVRGGWARNSESCPASIRSYSDPNLNVINGPDNIYVQYLRFPRSFISIKL